MGLGGEQITKVGLIFMDDPFGDRFMALIISGGVIILAHLTAMNAGPTGWTFFMEHHPFADFQGEVFKATPTL
jgi:hypothetical protein